jgi:hypothetical protein
VWAIATRSAKWRPVSGPGVRTTEKRGNRVWKGSFMALDSIGRRSAALAAMLLVSMGLSACTTTEGTNAFSDFGTFEREVMTSTAQGVGLVPKEVKPDPTNPRGPLVLPKSTAVLPPPEKTDPAVAMLPADSDKADINTSGLSAADIERAKHARVVDLNTPDGRPLTAAELKQLTGKMKNYSFAKNRSIFVPPEQYFEVTANHENLVCLAADGTLVAVNDPNCPIAIRNSLLKKKS